MQGAAWTHLLRRIPANLHDAVAVGLVTGAEVILQQIIKLEDDFAMVRGRMSGSTAEARIMLLPYAHMTLIAFNRKLSDAESQCILGDGGATAFAEVVPTASAVPAAESSIATPPTAAPAPSPAAADAKPAETKSEPVKPPPSKSILLARLRERLAEKGK